MKMKTKLSVFVFLTICLLVNSELQAFNGPSNLTSKKIKTNVNCTPIDPQGFTITNVDGSTVNQTNGFSVLFDDVLSSNSDDAHWHTPIGTAQVVLDLGAVYDISEIGLYDGNGTSNDRFTVAPGQPSDGLTPIIDIGTEQYNQWRAFSNLNTTSQYLTFTKYDWNSKINEIYICGTLANSNNCTISVNHTTGVCNNDGSPSDPLDDVFSFDLDVTGMTGTYTASLVGVPSFSNLQGTYGSTLEVEDVPIGDGSAITINIVDDNDASCTQSYIIDDVPNTCSNCTMTISHTSGDCNNEGTDADSSDDTFSLSLDVSGSTGTYLVTLQGLSGYSNISGTYGQTLSLDVPIGDGSPIIAIIVDGNDQLCIFNHSIDDVPSTCSNNQPGCPYTFDLATPIYTCDANQTPTDPSDDKYSFTINIDRTPSGGGTYVATPTSGGSIGGTFGTDATFGPYNINNASPIVLTIVENGNNTCMTTFTATIPSTCSNETPTSTASSFWNGATEENIDLYRSGRVYIGSNAFPTSIGGDHSNTNLFVQGDILTNKIKVALCSNGTWCDYVFDPQYNLMPLTKVKSYIQEYKHLPNVPSEADIEKEGSIDMGSITIYQQEKIEELFLYMIQLNETIETLKEKVEALEAENAALKQK